MMNPILAIDPGPERSGFLVWVEGQIGRHGVLPNAEILELCLANYRLTIEMIASYGMPVGREVFETCVWIGRFMEAHQPWSTKLIYRRDVKLHLCGSPRAKDANVWQALVDRFGAPGTKKVPGFLYGVRSHARAALALAVTAADKYAGVAW